MGATIKGRGMIFRKDHDGWSSYTLGVSSKDQEGKWLNAYQPVRFRKGVSVDNKTEIEYEAFPVVKPRMVEGQNRNYIVWQIMEFRIADDMAAPTDPDGYSALVQNDIPF